MLLTADLYQCVGEGGKQINQVKILWFLTEYSSVLNASNQL